MIPARNDGGCAAGSARPALAFRRPPCEDGRSSQNRARGGVMIRKQPIRLLFFAWALALLAAGGARAEDKPITIGFGMAQTGGLASGGKSSILAMEIWRDQINKKGGLLGRPVKLIYYDDQSNPSTVPAIYTKLLDVDKVDFIVSGYGTNQIAPAMPVAISHNRLFLGLFGLAVNSEFHYPRYFSD